MRRTINAVAALLLAVISAAAAAETPAVAPELLARFRPPAIMEPAPPAPIRDLGRTLFFDPILSGSGSTSCATCHNPGLSWASGLPRAIGDDGRAMSLRAPTLIDLAAHQPLGWDGKFRDLDSVTFAAISGHANMNLPVEEAIARLRRNAGYPARFARAFPAAGITQETVEQAIGAFERTIIHHDAAFDRFAAGDRTAIGADAQSGFLLFAGRAGCAQCHAGWTFTDGSFHDIGSAAGEDIGRGALFPTSRKLRYAFKTPTLRDVARRAPYMHDGAVPTLRDVLALYEKGGIDRPSRSELIHPLALSEKDRGDLIAFLATLTDVPAPVALPVLPR